VAQPSTRPRTRLRLLFDELSSSKVAKALKALGLQVERVGWKDQPPRGSDDAVVLEHARKCNQVVVTSNHDFIVLLCDQGESFVWLDGRGTSLTFYETVLRAFTQLEQWDREITNRGRPICVQALKTKINVLELEDAKRLALGRNRTRKARERRKAKQQVTGQETTGA
jgi:predicted nuclease of predicted toxin-antitoxin system